MNRQIIRLSGVSFTQPGLPVLDVTDEEIEIASMPGLLAWFDPQQKYRRVAPTGFNDRVNKYRLKSFSDNAPVLGTAINGKPTMTFTVANTDGVSIENLGLHPTGDYTKIVVAKYVAPASGRSELCAADAGKGTFAIIHGGGLRVGHGNTLRDTALGLVDAAPHIFACTYNAESGIAKLFLDGAPVTLPIPNLPPAAASIDLSFGVSKASGGFFNGDMGYGFCFAGDYSKRGYQGYWDRLHSILAGRYGITLA